MRVSIGADHAGTDIRAAIIRALKKKELHLIDHGTSSCQSVDYPDFACSVSDDIIKGKSHFGILICSTGIGMSIAANKIQGIRAALVHNADAARYCRLHNNANILCIGSKYQDADSAVIITNIFLETYFEGGRHQRRLNKISNIRR